MVEAETYIRAGHEGHPDPVAPLEESRDGMRKDPKVQVIVLQRQFPASRA